MINSFTSANHLPRLWQLFLLARSWTRMIPCTVWKKTCLVFRWLWLPPTSQSSTKKDFCCCVPSWNSCSFTCSQFKVSFFHVAIFTSIEQPTVQDGFGSAVSWLKKMASDLNHTMLPIQYSHNRSIHLILHTSLCVTKTANSPEKPCERSFSNPTVPNNQHPHSLNVPHDNVTSWPLLQSS